MINDFVVGTSRSSSTKTKKRKVKKRRRKRKRQRTTESKEDRKKQAGRSERVRSRNDVSPSRYLFPHEMEPSASFTLFGTDYNLDYLPELESRRPTTEEKPQK